MARRVICPPACYSSSVAEEVLPSVGLGTLIHPCHCSPEEGHSTWQFIPCFVSMFHGDPCSTKTCLVQTSQHHFLWPAGPVLLIKLPRLQQLAWVRVDGRVWGRLWCRAVHWLRSERRWQLPERVRQRLQCNWQQRGRPHVENLWIRPD